MPVTICVELHDHRFLLLGRLVLVVVNLQEQLREHTWDILGISSRLERGVFKYAPRRSAAFLDDPCFQV